MACCSAQTSFPGALPLREIRRQQRRLAALLQRHNIESFIPKMGRRPVGRKAQVCMCSRFDRNGNYENKADQYLSQGVKNNRKSSQVVLPGLGGVRGKSRSLEDLTGDDRQEQDGSWTDRDLHRIVVPRLDPLGQRFRKTLNVVRPKDIQDFSYSSLKKDDELVLPPIPQRTDPDEDSFCRRQTMFVPDNTPVSTANNDRSTRQPEVRSRGVTKTGSRLRNERSLSNFINQFGEIKEEGSEKTAFDVDFDTTDDDTSTHDDDKHSGRRTPEVVRQQVCACPFPDWQEVTSGGGDVTERCMKCGRNAPRSINVTPTESRNTTNILAVHHEGVTSSLTSSVTSVGSVDGRRTYAKERGEVSVTGQGRKYGSSKTNSTVQAGSRESSLTYPGRGVIQNGDVSSVELRRASVASSLSEMSDSAMDRAWREKLAQDFNIRSDVLDTKSREQSDAPSMTIKSYGHSSELDNEDSILSVLRNTSARKQTWTPTGGEQRSTKNAKIGKTLSFFESSDGTVINDNNYKENDKSRAQTKKTGGILRNKKEKEIEARAFDQETFYERQTEDIPLRDVPKRAYEKALARAQVEGHPSDHALLFLRITEPYKFSYFEPLIRRCPCCNEPTTGSKGSKVKAEKTNAAKKGKNKKPEVKEKKRGKKKFNEMKHIFGGVDVYDYYPGGKYNVQR